MMRTRRAQVAALLTGTLLLAGCDLPTIGMPGDAPAQPPADASEPVAEATEDGDEPAGDVACPIGEPREFTDTWGAARSGGRTHLGVDMLAPMDTPIYAYEDGTIARVGSNTLGGNTISLDGASGDQYYYAHLSRYVDGLAAGQQVAAGEQIGFTGDTGNAAGTPHLHFEVHPGGGDAVNPYPHAVRACG